MFSDRLTREVVSGRAFVQAMLDFEAALAEAEAGLGLVPAEHARAIRRACRAELFDIEEVGRDAAAAANPAGPLVEALRRTLPADIAASVHLGATSQDALDSAMVLVARRAGARLVELLGLAAAQAAALADEHRGRVMAGRTLLQQAVPITFGLKAAGWLVGLVEARRDLEQRLALLPVQLGGAAGTLASLGASGPPALAAVARILELEEPPLPWHSQRGAIAALGAALGIACGACARVATDVVLLAQQEVGEVRETGAGRSSAMPQKRNPARAVAIRAGAQRAQALVPVLMQSMVQEHERAAGAWQAEWATLADLLDLAGGVAANTAQMLEAVEVDPARMGVNVEASGGLLLAEAVAAALAKELGAPAARRAVDAAVVRALAEGRPLGDVLGEDALVMQSLGAEGLAHALEPARYLGSAELFIDRALALFSESGGR